MSDMVFSQRMPVTRFVPLKMLPVAPPLLTEKSYEMHEKMLAEEQRLSLEIQELKKANEDKMSRIEELEWEKEELRKCSKVSLNVILLTDAL